MTIDTTVTNGRFVAVEGVFEHSISIHDGRVLDSPEFNDVWRTIDASGHLIFPGMLQPGSLNGDTPLSLARRGTTTILAPHSAPDEQPAMDHILLSDSGPEARIVQVTDPDATTRARSGETLIEVDVALLHSSENAGYWAIVGEAGLPVHVTHGDNPDFPLLQFLYHAGKTACGLTPARIAEVTSVIPATWYGVHPDKGSFQTGSHGDVVVFDPESDDPYNESPWPGRVIMSFQRGDMLLYNGQLHAAPGSGKTLGS